MEEKKKKNPSVKINTFYREMVLLPVDLFKSILSLRRFFPLLVLFTPTTIYLDKLVIHSR